MTGISVVGLGKLGACMAACMAYKGYAVTGVDVNPVTLRLVNAGTPPVYEPGLAEMMAQTQGRLNATQDWAAAVRDSAITFIVVPTPSEDHGGFSLRCVKEAAREIGRALRNKPGYHLVVLTSTVLPGSSEYGVLPVLEQESGKHCGEDFGFCYGPEFIALGSVIHDFLNPDFILIGESDRRAGEHLSSLYQTICDNRPPVARLRLVNAELAKIAVNTYVTMKITFANTVAAICEQLPGGDIDQVTSAVGLDSRIGPRFLKGALGYGGPCFPRDNLALAHLARQLGQRALLAEATDACNRAIVDQVADRVTTLRPREATVAVLGLSYKPGTPVVEESQGLQLAKRLAGKGLRTMVYDPLATENAQKALRNSVLYADSLEQCAREADVLILANPDPAFAPLRGEAWPSRPGQMVFDAWRMLRGRFENNGTAHYAAVGVGSASSCALIARMEEMWSERLQRTV